MPLLQINLFGGVEVTLASGELVSIPSRKAATLLGYVALNSPHGVARGKLAALLWDGRFQENGRASLRQALLTLRRVLPQYDERLLVNARDHYWESFLIDRTITGPWSNTSRWP